MSDIYIYTLVIVYLFFVQWMNKSHRVELQNVMNKKKFEFQVQDETILAHRVLSLTAAVTSQASVV